MNIGFAGTPKAAEIILHGLLKANLVPKIVLTKPDSKKRNKFIQSPVATLASKYHIRTIKSLNDKKIKNEILSKNIDLMVVVAYGKILSSDLLNTVKYGWINIHYSKLPDLRGAAPVQRAILRGDNKFFGTIFKLDKNMDTGPIYKIFEITEQNGTANEIIENLSVNAIYPLINIIQNIKSLKPHTQRGTVTVAPKIKKSELEVKKSADFNKIRVGGAYFFYNNKKIEIIKAELSNKSVQETHEFIGGIKLLEVKPEGKNKMSIKAWMNGLK